MNQLDFNQFTLSNHALHRKRQRAIRNDELQFSFENGIIQPSFNNRFYIYCSFNQISIIIDIKKKVIITIFEDDTRKKRTKFRKLAYSINIPKPIIIR